MSRFFFYNKSYWAYLKYYNLSFCEDNFFYNFLQTIQNRLKTKENIQNNVY
ncbi:hypothetical protein SAMN05720759_105151 [Fibrobacter sp. UWB12]|nr:hypothetical protein SAMN05720759_105151 [Fibrobacter sp. UWB12]